VSVQLYTHANVGQMRIVHSCDRKAFSAKLRNWKIAGGGYGLHWPDLDEDLSTEGLLRGAPAPKANAPAN
jgi:hypothetical protein